MGDPLYGRDMERLARTRQQEGIQTQQAHREKDGLCRSCGRVSPCDAYEQAGELVQRYTEFLAAEPDPPAPPNLLLRPYVSALNTVGVFPNQGRW